MFANIRLGSLILLSAEKTEKLPSELSDAQLTPPNANQALKLDFLLSNNGNTHIFPQSKLAILNSRHELAGKAEGAIQRFFPLAEGSSFRVLVWSACSGHLHRAPFSGLRTG